MIPEVKPITSLFNKRSEVSLDKISLKHYLEKQRFTLQLYQQATQEN